MTFVSKNVGIPGGLNNILVVRLGAMGDILRTLPALRKIRREIPAVSIHWACDDRWIQVLEAHPDLNGLVPFPRTALDSSRSSPSGWLQAVRLALAYRRELREKRFDLVLDFHGNLRSGLLGRLSGAAVRIGYDGHQQKEGNRLFTTHRVPSGDRRVSRIARNMSLLAPLGVEPSLIPGDNLPLDPGIDRAAAELVRASLGPGRRYAVVSPGASVSQGYKKPPPALLAAAARRLARSGIGVLITHGPGEIGDAETVAKLSEGSGKVSPPTSLPLLFHLIRNAALFIGGDTGPLHVACAVDTPVLGIYGPTDPVVNAPWNVPHETVSPPGRRYSGIKRSDRAAGGFDGLTAELVLQALERLLPRCRQPSR